jgi:hypothetical protein
MFEGQDFPKALEEEVFNGWLETGRLSRIGYSHLVIVWDDYESAYHPIYVAHRSEIDTYKTSNGRERFIAAYDLYSESKIA